MTRTRIAGAWLAVAIFLGGCNCFCCCGDLNIPFLSPHAEPLTISEAAGTYQGPGSAKVILVADGTFTAEHIDDCGPDDFGHVPGPAEKAAGTWGLGEEGDWGNAITLELDFDPPDRFHDGADSDWYAQPDNIYYLSGDPDSPTRCEFRKL